MTANTFSNRTLFFVDIHGRFHNQLALRAIPKSLAKFDLSDLLVRRRVYPSRVENLVLLATFEGIVSLCRLIRYCELFISFKSWLLNLRRLQLWQVSFLMADKIRLFRQHGHSFLGVIAFNRPLCGFCEFLWGDSDVFLLIFFILLLPEFSQLYECSLVESVASFFTLII